MNTLLSHVTACGIMLSVVFFSGYQAVALETEGWIPQIEVLTPDTSRTFQIEQAQNFPFDFSQFLILALGHGALNVTLFNTDNKDGNFLILTGMAISPAGILPVFKIAVTNVMLREVVAIGSENYPYGFLWISCGVYSLVNAGPYTYTLQLSF